MYPTTISEINLLPFNQKREIYSRLIPQELVNQFALDPLFLDTSGNDLLEIKCDETSTSTEMKLHHKLDFPDPILYGHITDTPFGQIHVLLYILNNPDSPRFDVDRLPDGTKTLFGTASRNIPAEISALEFGLAPGQVRKGLRLLSPAIIAFENFVSSLGHNIYFAEPLYYHNAILFEKYGFTYAKGKKAMEIIHKGFSPGGNLRLLLNNSSPFRRPEAANSIRLRSWAIQDGILDEPFTGYTMYKQISKSAGLNSSTNCNW